MEEKVIKPFYHNHPLILIEPASNNNNFFNFIETLTRQSIGDCYVCGDSITSMEKAYTCTNEHCRETHTGPILHTRCRVLATEISHPKHPQHPLLLHDYHNHLGKPFCDVCLKYLGKVLGYRCSQSGCEFNVDIACTKFLQGERHVPQHLPHPSHPNHPLTLMRKPAFSFCCDACGFEDVDMAYICSTCEFWIHKSCATLPLTLPINLKYHHHQLSLAFSVPMEHRDYIFYCDVCRKRLNQTCNWVYFCGDCRFFAHLRCVTSKTTHRITNLRDDIYESYVTKFPVDVHDISKELITPFVIKENIGLPIIRLSHKYLPKVLEATASLSSSSNPHKHSLILVSDEEDHDHNKNMIMDEDGDEDDEESKICNVCITPISSPPYYKCTPCQYFVHSICYALPKTLSYYSISAADHTHSLCPKTQYSRHKFTLYNISSDSEANLHMCELCNIYTNGMMYECEWCKMKIDVKCASLPTIIKHASHHHLLTTILLLKKKSEKGSNTSKCHACGENFNLGYYCNSDDCDFALDFKCAMLPPSVRKHEWDNHDHPLLLSYDASLDHPSGFVCDFCEGGMNPKGWMYHCRQCDHSYHLFCLEAASGRFRNVKFGSQVVLDAGVHPHPLTYTYVTLMKRCRICRQDVYTHPGFQCVSCYYVVCIQCMTTQLPKIMS